MTKNKPPPVLSITNALEAGVCVVICQYTVSIIAMAMNRTHSNGIEIVRSNFLILVAIITIIVIIVNSINL